MGVDPEMRSSSPFSLLCCDARLRPTRFEIRLCYGTIIQNLNNSTWRDSKEYLVGSTTMTASRVIKYKTDIVD